MYFMQYHALSCNINKVSCNINKVYQRITQLLIVQTNIKTHFLKMREIEKIESFTFYCKIKEKSPLFAVIERIKFTL